MQIIVTCNDWLSSSVLKNMEFSIEKYLKQNGEEREIMFRFFNLRQKLKIHKLEIIISSELLFGKNKKVLLEGIQKTAKISIARFSNGRKIDISIRTSEFSTIDVDFSILRREEFGA